MVVCDENGINTEDIQLLDIFAMQTSTMLENTKLNFNLRKEVDKRTSELNNAFNELKKLDSLKDEFLAMVSHELRTPLTSILAYMETIIADLSENYMDEETKGEFLHIIQDEAKRLKLIVDDVLELSKLEAGKMVYNNRETDLNAILEDLCVKYLPLIETGGIFLKKSIETIPTVKCDTEKITKVLSNIMSNAVKFTGTNGTITAGSYTSGNNVILFIRDTGIGISEDNFRKIFSRFEQIEDISHHSKGTGLGLPIAKLIMEQQNGKIWFESKEGAGSTFYIMLPSS
jgi:signal transduction histidine kinase